MNRRVNLLKRLLTNGYLPRELPPFFSSETLGKLSDATALDSAFTKDSPPQSMLMQHSLLRVGGLRRRITIPNPVNYFRLARLFQNNDQMLQGHWHSSPYSKTIPILHQSGERALAGTQVDRSTARIASRVNCRYLLQTDISQFYPSIYTHSIPWVLHGKDRAKAEKRNKNLIGNLLDRELQESQHGQTKGIPIGPDTSLGIAELLLSHIDLAVKENCAVQGGVRFIDDIELGFKKASEAEEALAFLESHLQTLELQLNAGKTRIVELPVPHESIFVSKLRGFVPSDSSVPRSRWIDYFNKAIYLAKNNPNEGVLRYAVSVLQSLSIDKKFSELIQNLLWQCVVADPGCIRFVVDVLLIQRERSDFDLDVENGSAVINDLLERSAVAGHGNEVIWCIWAALALQLQISTSVQSKLALVDDDFVACASMLAKDSGLFGNKSEFTSELWVSWCVDQSFEQEHWLYTYEASKRGWANVNGETWKIKDSSSAAQMLSKGITFLDTTVLKNYVPSKLQTFSGGGGGY
jgi:hypothetical protein